LGYPLDAAINVLDSVKLLSGATTIGMEDLLRQAFGIAAEIDTNPYRRETTQLKAKHTYHKLEEGALSDADKTLDGQIKSLELEQSQAQENELAYQDFLAKGNFYPEELRLEPLKAKEWAEKTREDAQGDLNRHNLRVGELSQVFASWGALTAQHGITPLGVALKELDDGFSSAKTNSANANAALNQSISSRGAKQDELGEKNKATSGLQTQVQQLEIMKASEPVYREIFGDADPGALNPVASLKRANHDLQVATNLLTNAMNYTPIGGEVSLHTAIVEAEERPWVTFSVQDTGPGIAEEELPHLFNRFFRGQAGQTSKAAGTGLGLAICKEIVTLHDGRITLDSVVGQGCTFTVWLPQREA